MGSEVKNWGCGVRRWLALPSFESLSVEVRDWMVLSLPQATDDDNQSDHGPQASAHENDRRRRAKV